MYTLYNMELYELSLVMWYLFYFVSWIHCFKKKILSSFDSVLEIVPLIIFDGIACYLLRIVSFVFFFFLIIFMDIEDHFHVYVFDFCSSSQSSVLHSQPKSTVGTPAYIAPEVLLRKEYDGKVYL